MEIRRYISASGKDIFGDYIKNLKDIKTKAIINTRIARVSVGNMGDCKFLKDGVSEIRIDYGSGYRVYFSKVGKEIVLLLCAGDKRTQQKDIEKAIDYLKDFKKRAL